MTKADLVEKIAAKANLTKAAAERALNAFLASVEDALVKESKLTLTGFGTFAVEHRKARQGRNPRTCLLYTSSRQRTARILPRALRACGTRPGHAGNRQRGL